MIGGIPKIGASTYAALLVVAGLVYSFIQEWVESGEPPTKLAIAALIAAIGLGVSRVYQAKYPYDPNRPQWGATSLSLLVLLLGAVATYITEWQQSGQASSALALIGSIVTAAFAMFRGYQAAGTDEMPVITAGDPPPPISEDELQLLSE